jgi:hypothetical protein
MPQPNFVPVRTERATHKFRRERQFAQPHAGERRDRVADSSGH